MSRLEGSKFGDGVQGSETDPVSRILAEEAQFTMLSMLAGVIQGKDVDEAKRVFDHRFTDVGAEDVGSSFDNNFSGSSTPVLKVINGGKQ